MSEMNLIQWMTGMLAIVFLYFLYLLQRDRESCRWEYDSKHCLYETECGVSFFFMDTQRPEDYHFCHHCGRQIVEVENNEHQKT